MKVVMTFEWTDARRAELVQYLRMVEGRTRLPKLARRADIKAFIADAIEAQWSQVGDDMTSVETWQEIP